MPGQGMQLHQDTNPFVPYQQKLTLKVQQERQTLDCDQNVHLIDLLSFPLEEDLSFQVIVCSDSMQPEKRHLKRTKTNECCVILKEIYKLEHRFRVCTRLMIEKSKGSSID